MPQRVTSQSPSGSSSSQSGGRIRWRPPRASYAPGQAQVGDPALVVVVDQADERPGRDLDDHRPGRAQVQHAAGVGGVGVQREADVPGLADDDHAGLVVDGAGRTAALEDRPPSTPSGRRSGRPPGPAGPSGRGAPGPRPRRWGNRCGTPPRPPRASPPSSADPVRTPSGSFPACSSGTSVVEGGRVRIRSWAGSVRRRPARRGIRPPVPEPPDRRGRGSGPGGFGAGDCPID